MFKTADGIASTALTLSELRATSAQPIKGKLYAVAALLMLLAALALWVDVPIAYAIKTHRMSGEARHLLRLAEVFAWGGSVGYIILAAAVLDPRGWRIVPRLVIGAFGSGAVANGLKLLIARSRPIAADLQASALDSFGAWLPMWDTSLEATYNRQAQSFPSGHAATAAGLAVALAVLYPRGRWLFVGFAMLAALQRVEVQAHFLSDVLAGAALGCALSAACNGNWALGRWLSKLDRDPSILKAHSTRI